MKFCKLFLLCKLHHEKHFFFHGRKKLFFFCYFFYEITICCAELFEYAINFKFFYTTFIFLKINTNQALKEQNLNFIRTYFGRSCREVLRKHMPGSNLPGLQIYLMGIFENFGHIFKILKVGNIFLCVTSCYQYLTKVDEIVATIKLIVKTCITSINMSLTMISMRVM